MIVELVQRALDGDLDGAREVQTKVEPLNRIVYAFGEPSSSAHRRMQCARWLLGKFPSPKMRRPSAGPGSGGDRGHSAGVGGARLRVRSQMEEKVAELFYLLVSVYQICRKGRTGGKHENRIIQVNLGFLLIQQGMTDAFFVTCIAI